MASPADLWRVAETNDTRALEWILSSGIDVDARNEHGTTALMRAAYHGHLQMVEALIASGADPNAVRNDNFTPLTLAAFFGHTDIVRVLVQAGAETDRVTRNGTSARMWASARTFHAVASYLDAVQPSPCRPDAATSEKPTVIIDEPQPETKEYESEHQFSEEIGNAHLSGDTIRGDVPELAPLVAGHNPIRFVSLTSRALIALFVIGAVVGVAFLLRVPFGRDSQIIQTTAVGPPLVTSRPEVRVSRNDPVPNTEVEQSANSLIGVEKTDTPRVTVRNVAHTSKRLGSNSDVKVKESVTSRPKNEMASDPVNKPSPTSKQTVPPLSTQLVSSPSKSAIKPKVIQWP